MDIDFGQLIQLKKAELDTKKTTTTAATVDPVKDKQVFKWYLKWLTKQLA